MLIQLPNGLLESGGSELFNYVEIDELRGKQQNYLVDQSLVVGNIGHIPKILEDLVLSFQTAEGFTWKGKIAEAIRRVPAEDLETILIKIRELTYGPRYYFSVECPSCSKVNKNLRLDLDKLALDVLPLEKLVEKKVIVLPKMGVEIELEALKLDDLFKSIKITKEKNNSLVTACLALSVKRLGDKTNITEKDIEQISASDLYFLNSETLDIKLAGSIDTDVEVTCKDCGHEFVYKLNTFDPAFFDPSRGSAS